MNLEIRKAVPDEASKIIEINNIVWADTYKNILSEEVIEKKRKKASQRIESWKESIQKENNVYVAVVDGEIVGYNSFGKAKDVIYENCGEIYAGYILKDYQGLQIGRKLAIACIEELLKNGFTTMVSRCLDGNIFNEFHKAIGGVFIKQEDHVLQDYPVKENLYYHSDLNKTLKMNLEKLNASNNKKI